MTKFLRERKWDPLKQCRKKLSWFFSTRDQAKIAISGLSSPNSLDKKQYLLNFQASLARKDIYKSSLATIIVLDAKFYHHLMQNGLCTNRFILFIG